MKIIIFFVLFIKHVLSSSLDSALSDGECNYCRYRSCTPTVFPALRFDAKDDAKRLEAAITRRGSLENNIVSILTSRSDYQRVKISKEYISTGKVLIDEVKQGVKSDALNLLEALTKPLPIFLADEIHDASLAKDYQTLNEIFVSLPNCAIREISVYYRLTYKTSLIDDINANHWFSYKYFLQMLAKADRNESDEIDEQDAKREAQTLVNALPITWRLKRPEIFINIFTKYAFPELTLIIEYYDLIRKSNDPTYKSIFEDFTGYFGNYLAHGLDTIVRNARDQRGFFSRELHYGFLEYTIPRNKRAVIRILRSRCEVDLNEIKRSYLRRYKTSLVQQIPKHLDSETRKAFYAILNEPF